MYDDNECRVATSDNNVSDSDGSDTPIVAMVVAVMTVVVVVV